MQPTLYNINSLLCIQCRTEFTPSSDQNFIPCSFTSKHKQIRHKGMIAINQRGVILTCHYKPKFDCVLLSWSSIFTWRKNVINRTKSLFYLYIVGLIHPQKPNDTEALVAMRQIHSFKVNGFDRDASLDFCCLAILIDDAENVRSVENALVKFALCGQKERGEFFTK